MLGRLVKKGKLDFFVLSRVKVTERLASRSVKINCSYTFKIWMPTLTQMKVAANDSLLRNFSTANFDETKFWNTLLISKTLLVLCKTLHTMLRLKAVSSNWMIRKRWLVFFSIKVLSLSVYLLNILWFSHRNKFSSDGSLFCSWFVPSLYFNCNRRNHFVFND